MVHLLEKRTTRRAALVALTLALLALFSPAHADGDKAARLSVTVNAPEGDSGDEKLERERLEQITKRVASRIDQRLEAAGVKDFSVEANRPPTIEVTARGTSRSLLVGMVMPSGDFELRPIESIGERWMRRIGELPEGVELRQPEGSIVSGEAFVWSRSDAKLREVLEAVDIEGFKLAVYPHEGGWRSVAMAQPVATHRQVAGASIHRGKTGEPHVRVDFERSISAADSHTRARTKWAAMVDQEVVSVFHRGDDGMGANLTLPAPSHLGSRQARSSWARQVAARLAAHIPFVLVEATQD